MIRVLYGSEPYFALKYRQALARSIETPEMNLSRFEGEFNEDVLNTCLMQPFLSKKRAVFLDVDSLKKLDNQSFYSYLAQPVPSTDLCITARSVDARTSVFKKLNDVLYKCDKLTKDADLVQAIREEVKSLGAVIQPEAVTELVRRVNYFDLEDMNLIMIAGYLKTMAAMTKDISKEVVEEVVPVFSVPNAFGLTRLVEEGNIEELLGQLHMVSDKDALKVMGLLMKELRVAIKLKHFSEDEVGVRPSWVVFQSHPENVLLQCLNVVSDTSEGIKSGRFTNGIGLKYAFAAVSDLLAA